MTRRRPMRFAALASLMLLAGPWAAGGCGDTDTDIDTDTDAPTGVVVVSIRPDDIDASWQLAGPDSYSLDGTEATTVEGLSTGDYTITWGDVHGYVTPPEETQSLAEDETVTFTGSYAEAVGSIHVVPGPEYLYHTWTLTGPAGISLPSFEEQTFSSMPIGDYTVTWDEQEGWITPDPETLTLTAEGTITFSATYTPGPNTILITKEPADITVSWGLTGPDSYSAGGQGTSELLVLLIAPVVPGEYTMTWHDVDGWTTPAPQTATLEEGSTLHLHGVYVEE